MSSVPPVPIEVNASGVTGHKLDLLGVALLQIKLGKKTHLHLAHVTLNCPYNILFGTDFQQLLDKVTNNYAKRHVLFGKTIVPLLLHDSLKAGITAVQTLLIPKRVQLVVQAKISKQDIHLNGEEWIIEANQKFVNRTGLLVANALVRAHTDIVPIRIINTTEQEIKVFRETTMAYALPTHSIQSITTVYNPINHIQSETVISKHTLNENVHEVANALDKLDLSEADLTEVEKAQLLQVLHKYKSAFALHDYDLGRCTIIEHAIDTGNAEPVRKPPYRTPFAQRTIVENELKKMLDMGIIEPSISPWASPTTFVSIFRTR